MSGIVISLVNSREGAGKTTVAVNLAHALTRRGKRILVIDMDPQSTATDLLLPMKPSERNTLHEIFMNENIDAEQCIYPTGYENLFCLPNTPNTGALEPMLLKTLPASFYIPRKRIRDYARDNHDFTLMDCPSNLGFFSISALHSSDAAVAPLRSEPAFNIEGLRGATVLINDIRENGNPDLRLLSFLVNLADRRTAASKITIAQLKKNFPENNVFTTVIPSGDSFRQAEDEQKSIIRYDPGAPGAKAFRTLAREFLDLFDNAPRDSGAEISIK